MRITCFWPTRIPADAVALAFGSVASDFCQCHRPECLLKEDESRGISHQDIVGYQIDRKLDCLLEIPGGTRDQYFFGMSPEGFGLEGMLVNFIVEMAIAKLAVPPTGEFQ